MSRFGIHGKAVIPKKEAMDVGDHPNYGLQRKPFYKPTNYLNRQHKKPMVLETFDKTRDIMRCIYPITKSASKQIIVAMDPIFEFLPCVTIAKTGMAGVKLPHYAFKNLCSSEAYISDYFTEHHDGDNVVNLGPEVVVEFHKQYKSRVISFCTDVQTNGAQRVTIVESTWKELKKIFELVTYVFKQQETWTIDAQQLYESLREHCKSYFPGQTDNHTNMEQLKEFLQGLKLEDLDFVQRQECYLDVERAFMEMKIICAYDIAGSM